MFRNGSIFSRGIRFIKPVFTLIGRKPEPVAIWDRLGEARERLRRRREIDARRRFGPRRHKARARVDGPAIRGRAGRGRQRAGSRLSSFLAARRDARRGDARLDLRARRFLSAGAPRAR